LVLFISLLASAQAQRPEDEVKSLPGQSFQNLSSRWFSGHFNVSKGRHLHYLFMESQDKPATDPVIVYFNGGPGGASIFLSFVGMGPYVVNQGISELFPW
jgi:carboxypeptidase C (cathepsin A)